MEIYRGFLRRISNPVLKAYFVKRFDSKIYVKCQDLSNNVAPSQSPSKPHFLTNRKISSKEMYDKDIVNVSPIMFSYKITEKGPRLVYRSHMCRFYGEKNWFQYRVLKSIDRTFKIRINDCTGFSFVPFTDKQEFASILEQKYNEVQSQIYNEELTDCLDKIDQYIKNRILSYINSCRRFVIKTSKADYFYDKNKQVYILNIDIIKYLKISNQSLFHIPLKEILEKSEMEDYSGKYKEEIAAQWPDGYSGHIKINDIFPNLCCSKISIVIHDIYFERLNLNMEDYVDIIIEYTPANGRFLGSISRNSFCKLDYHHTESSKAIFSDAVKFSLIEILRTINDKFILMFYSSFKSMYHENDSIIQPKYDHYYNQILSTIDDFVQSWRLDRYKSGFGLSSLVCFNKNNDCDWRWLNAQMRNGVFMESYSFYDRDFTYSMEIFQTKTPVKVYLAVEMQGIVCTETNDIIAKKEYLTVRMYALDTSKSIYCFIVKESKVYEALFFIWSYFGSNDYNKRQGFAEILLQWEETFGICKFYKEPPLKYKHGIGYYDRRWPMVT